MSSVNGIADQFLEMHEVNRGASPKIFALTPSSLAISVYRQQIRALNLAFALSDKTADPAKERVAVIGGGFAGITVAAGLLKNGFEVHLFEQRPELCHLQSGCETRWLHPTIYEWPRPNSDLTDARLPLLNWSAGTAGDVARVVVRQFKRMSENASYRCHEYLGANARLNDSSVEWDNAESSSKPGWLGRGGREDFSIVIVAVGFGVEIGVHANTTTSYWRNDRFGQPRPGTRSERREVVCVSGIGDGALIDLIRVCLRGFKHDRLIDDMFENLPMLIAELDQIRESHATLLKTNSNVTLAAEFTSLQQRPRDSELGKQFEEFRRRLASRLRGDTHSILNGKASSFSQILTSKNRSFLNVFLAYCLYQENAFSYIGGESRSCDDQLAIDIHRYGRLRFDEGIFRHGTKRKQVLRTAGLHSKEIQELFKKQNGVDTEKFAVRLWEPGWWSTAQKTSSTHADIWWLERVPRLEQVLSTALLGPLTENLANLPSMKGCKFRTTIHRTLFFPATYHCYQQLAPYFGNASGERLRGDAGRVFLTSPHNAKAGAVGFTIKTGLSLFAQLPQNAESTDKTSWDSFWGKLLPSQKGTSRFRAMDSHLVTTVATVPIIAEDNNQFSVRYVLYVDIEQSSDGGLPLKNEVLQTLWNVASGAERSISTLRDAKADEEPLLVTRTAVRDSAIIRTPEREKWGEKPLLGEFQWIADEYNEIVHLEYPSSTTRTLASTDVLELRSLI